MGKRPKRRNAATTPNSPDIYVENALRDNFRSMWKDSGFPETAVEQNTASDMRWLHEYGYCTYAALEQAKENGGFERFDKRSHLNQIAAETLENLQGDAIFLSIVNSEQETQCQSAQTVQMKMCADTSEKKHAAKTGAKGKPDAAQTSSKLASENTMLVVGAQSEVIEMAKSTMLEHAELKARKEMQQQFDYDSLCPQGKQLFELVLVDKVKRLYSKIKHRQKRKEKKKVEKMKN